MKPDMQRINKLIKFMDSMPCRKYVDINEISRDSDDFIEAIKLCIDHLKLPYEFNSNYTKVRRIEDVKY